MEQFSVSSLLQGSCAHGEGKLPSVYDFSPLTGLNIPPDTAESLFIIMSPLLWVSRLLKIVI